MKKLINGYTIYYNFLNEMKIIKCENYRIKDELIYLISSEMIKYAIPYHNLILIETCYN